MNLAKFQETFKKTMLTNRNDMMKRASELDDFIISDKISSAERLKIYHNNIVGGLTEILREHYPLCEDLIGEEYFKELCRAFIFKNPPISGCMILYGIGLDDFIKTYTKAKDLTYLSDIAKLEWALHHAYYAEDDSPVTAEFLSQIPPDKLAGLNLPLRKSATLISSAHPLTEIRDFCSYNPDGKELDITTKGILYFLVSRNIDMEVQITPLKECEYTILQELNNSRLLGEAVSYILERHHNFDFTVFLHKHISLETFAEVNANKVERKG